MFQLQHFLGFTFVFLFVSGFFFQIGWVPLGITFAIASGVMFFCSGLKYLNG